jgi:hypothetical protein
MRTIKMSLCLAVLLLLGSGSNDDTLDAILESFVTANPAGTGQFMSGTGSYTVAPANTFQMVQFRGYNTRTQQLNGIAATVTKDFIWDGTLQVVAGNYDAYGVLFTLRNGRINQTKSNVVNTDVK